MQLTKTIARQIVERTMKIIKFSVVVMDENGWIIGSGDPRRLNQRHEGAILAMGDNRVLEIDDAMAASLKGVLPGINLPILFQGKPIGVVGISGKPEQVSNYGELVKMTAELVVEQAALMDQIQWSKRHREELVLSLTHGQSLNESQLLSVADRLQLDLTQPRIAAIVKVFPYNRDGQSHHHLQRLVQLLEYPQRDNLVAISSVSDNEVVVLKPVELTDEGWSVENERKRVDKLMKRISGEDQFRIRIALGEFFPGLRGLARSYQTAKATLDAAGDHGEVLFYQDHILPVLLSGLNADSWRQQQLQQPLQLLQAADGNGSLLRTLHHYFDQDCDLSRTCDTLHIHRNTLRYRLDKVSSITGLDIHTLSDRTRLYLAMLNR
ncbi:MULTISPECIES: sugar diacid recognition domain-containing protein [Ferrimonas]|uniref:sugar diacid recognition domain-containing protein n=1 Tax=Ferrimonas TaxID=44011 RepID=UPI000411A2B5|nr:MULTISPECIES: sugar diacid recognition domain-containing protein [Ferrimonas]USD36842.1 helix-turn-helix domain-containing protein [Ferrimonas sp. SCSIO 43195]